MATPDNNGTSQIYKYTEKKGAPRSARILNRCIDAARGTLPVSIDRIAPLCLRFCRRMMKCGARTEWSRIRMEFRGRARLRGLRKRRGPHAAIARVFENTLPRV